MDWSHRESDGLGGKTREGEVSTVRRQHLAFPQGKARSVFERKEAAGQHPQSSQRRHEGRISEVPQYLGLRIAAVSLKTKGEGL